MKYLALLFLTTLTYAQNFTPVPNMTGDSVVPNDEQYYKSYQDNIEIIYTKDNLPFARHTADLEPYIHRDYEYIYDWKLDETLFVGLASSHNQIANGFSTQLPNNRQINYIGGTQLVDYFSSTSWLDTLLYHETAHNYQLNVKGHVVSKSLHSIFGNGMFILPLPMTVPNAMENSFMLEGNAVLNESWHGNGGRLYSGRFKAQTILQAKAGNIVASDVYNQKLSFPYSETHYIQGGFYNLYLAEMYGLENINNYFKLHSENYIWPQYTNRSMKRAVGVDFETSLDEYSKKYASMPLVEAEGERVASSQFFYPLNSDKDEIFFMTNESGVRAAELLRVDKKSLHVKKSRESYLGGKVVKADDKYYTQGSKKTSSTRVYQGLFDGDGFIRSGSESKMVQGYLSDGREVYFDVASSYSQPQLYVGGNFYAQVNSTVLIDKNDNIYYFVQREKERTLYKNKEPLFSYRGFYGIVSDVDSKGNIYFIANSEYGSTLYAYDNRTLHRVSDADNIIEAKLIDENKVFMACISDKEYYYVINELKSIKQTPHETKLFFEDREYYGNYAPRELNGSALSLSQPYSSIFEMHYSATDLFLVSDANGTFGSLNIKFGDPLSQNSANIFISKDESAVSVAGVGYSNSQYLLNYTLSAYSVVDKNEMDDLRDNGVILGAALPFYESGYYYGGFEAGLYQDYADYAREPLSLSAVFARSERYGVSMYDNYSNMVKIYMADERGDKIYGGEYAFNHDLPYEFYTGLSAKYSITNREDYTANRGVKMTNSGYQLDKDPSTVYVPSLNKNYYLKKVSYIEGSISKVLNLSHYFFTFPLSVQRESLYAKYRYYNLESFNQNTLSFHEATVGMTLNTVVLNSFSLPVSIEYIYNDAIFLEEKQKLRFILGINF